jgi:hypothetical protein
MPKFKRLKVMAEEIPENRDKPLKESGEERKLAIKNTKKKKKKKLIKGKTALCKDPSMKKAMNHNKIGRLSKENAIKHTKKALSDFY